MTKSGESDEGESNNNVVEKITRIVDENKRVITWSCYAVSAAGVIIGLRSLKLFKQFKKISDFPEEYFKNNSHIFGIVERVEVSAPEVPRLHISHVPIVGRQDRSPPHLSVRIHGVDLHRNFLSHSSLYLSPVEGQKVKVKMLGHSSDAEEIQGRVFRKQYGLWRQCLGSALVKRGYGQVATEDFKRTMFNSGLANYQSDLEKMEIYAKKNRLGLWQSSQEGTPKVTNVFHRIFSNLFGKK